MSKLAEHAKVAAAIDVAVDQDGSNEAPLSDVAPGDLKRRTVHGALASGGAQAATFVLRLGSMMVLARLLLKEDFGLVNMVTAFTGFLGLFRDAGLSMATVQRETITNAQTSTLFWVNLALGTLLAALAALGAPILAAFYGEPRLVWVTVALGATFIFNGASTQHRAILQRNLRFGMLASMDIVSLVVSILVGVVMAATGFGYWSLVGMTFAQPVASGVGVWLATQWIPGRPRRNAGIRSMLQFGGTVTLNNVIVYFAYNADKVLVGRFFGAEALGIYGRAYQLINISTDNLSSAMGSVAFPALARVQNDPERLRRLFLTGYNILLSLTLPVAATCALFADDIILVFLGSKWHEAASIFRLLTPTIVAFALINPFGWLLYAAGRGSRSLMIALMIAPVVVVGYVVGLPHGPQGVALGFSLAMALLVGPVIIWSKHGTMITGFDILRTIGPIVGSIGVGIVAALASMRFLATAEPPILRLLLESVAFFGTYFAVLLFVMGQKSVYLQLFQGTGIWPFSSRRSATQQ